MTWVELGKRREKMGLSANYYDVDGMNRFSMEGAYARLSRDWFRFAA